MTMLNTRVMIFSLEIGHIKEPGSQFTFPIKNCICLDSPYESSDKKGIYNMSVKLDSNLKGLVYIHVNEDQHVLMLSHGCGNSFLDFPSTTLDETQINIKFTDAFDNPMVVNNFTMVFEIKREYTTIPGFYSQSLKSTLERSLLPKKRGEILEEATDRTMNHFERRVREDLDEIAAERESTTPEESSEILEFTSPIKPQEVFEQPHEIIDLDIRRSNGMTSYSLKEKMMSNDMRSPRRSNILSSENSNSGNKVSNVSINASPRGIVSQIDAEDESVYSDSLKISHRPRNIARETQVMLSQDTFEGYDVARNTSPCSVTKKRCDPVSIRAPIYEEGIPPRPCNAKNHLTAFGCR